MHAHKTHAHEMHAYEMHTYEVYPYEKHAHEMHAHEMHAHEVHMKGFCEDLARHTTTAHLFQLQLGFQRCRIWVSVVAVVS